MKIKIIFIFFILIFQLSRSLGYHAQVMEQITMLKNSLETNLQLNDSNSDTSKTGNCNDIYFNAYKGTVGII